MQIKIIAVGDAELKTGKTGKPYSSFELTFKNLDKNQTQSKKIMSFDKKIYEQLQASHPGDVYDITSVKEGEFYNWKEATKGTASVVNEGASSSTSKSSAYANFNDDSKQLSIVRQFSVKAAVQFVNNNPNYDGTVEAVFKVAKMFQDYVMNPDDFEVDGVEEKENEVE